MSVPFLSEAFDFFSSGKNVIDIDTAMLLVNGLGFSHSSEEELAAIVRSMDSTSIGKVKEDQVRKGVVKSRIPLNGPEELWRVFVLVDANSTGRIIGEDLHKELFCDRTIESKHLDDVCSLFEENEISFDTWRTIFTTE